MTSGEPNPGQADSQPLPLPLWPWVEPEDGREETRGCIWKSVETVEERPRGSGISEKCLLLCLTVPCGPCSQQEMTDELAHRLSSLKCIRTVFCLP